MTRRSKKTCAAAITALSAAAIIMAAPVQAQISGFDSGSYTLNTNGQGDPASISGGDLNLTTAVNNEANSAWYNTPQNASAFTTSFTWTRTDANQYAADGYTFALQNTGVNALGANGGSTGFAGANGTTGPILPNVNSSYAVGFEYFISPYTDIWIEQGINGSFGTPVDTLLPYAGGPVNVQISYDGATTNVNLTQGSSTYSTSYAVNLGNAIESSTAFVGFTGGTGGYNAGQQISNFTFTPVTPTASSPNPTPGLVSISSAADVVESVDAGGVLNPTGSKNSGDGAVTNLEDNNFGTKYLNFTGNTPGGAGFTDTPAIGSSVVQGLAITSANDSPERDPSSYILYGSNDGTFSVSSPVISQGSIPIFANRFETQYVTFANSTAYTSYELMFPTVADNAVDANGAHVPANSMAVSEVRLLAAAPEPGAPAALVLGGLGLLGLVARRRRASA